MLRILHLSDLHFGRLLPSQQKKGQSASAHRFARGDEPVPEALADVLLGDPSLAEVPDLIIISGDIGWSGVAEDYSFAHVFLGRLTKQWKKTRFVIAPGNHDVLRSNPESRQTAFIDFLRKFHGGRFTTLYPLFLSTAPDRRLLIAFEHIKNVSGTDLLVVAVNSAAYLEGESTPVRLDPFELQAIERHIQKLKLSPKTLRLFVLHHHVLPFAEPGWQHTRDPDTATDTHDATMVANSAKLQAWLSENMFRLVLHGHKHSMHGREDVLWQRDDPLEGRRLFIVGAGSSGVEQGHRAHNEPLSYNILSLTQLSAERWDVSVAVQHVVEGATTKSRRVFGFGTSVGAAPSGAPLIFHADRMDDCHRAIKQGSEDKGLLRSFVSVVESHQYHHPDTSRIGGRKASREDVINTFRTLHPEHERSDSWKDLKRLDEALREVSRRFQFQHGPRLFGTPTGRGTLGGEDPTKTRPILRAVTALESKNTSKAYAGLFDPELDVRSVSEEPMPGLVGIQFVPDGQFLDAVATFRKIELSYWWVVNMYEMGELLRWAAQFNPKLRLQPRRITFLAAMAEWKIEPEAAFITRLDAKPLEELAALASSLPTDAKAKQELVDLLLEKRTHTHDNNLDASGLHVLAQLLKGLLSAKGKRAKAPFTLLASKLTESASLIRAAMEQQASLRHSEAQKASRALDEALSLLGAKQEESE